MYLLTCSNIILIADLSPLNATKNQDAMHVSNAHTCKNGTYMYLVSFSPSNAISLKHQVSKGHSLPLHLLGLSGYS